MAVFNGAFPVLPGHEDDARRFAEEVGSERKAEFDEMQRRGGVTRETWSVQQTPMGSFVLVWFEAPDLEAPFVDLATSGDDFTKWFVGRVKDVTGVDMTAPDDSPPPETVLEWST